MTMFSGLTQRLTNVFDKLNQRGILREADVEAALRDIRIALLEADVSLPVVKHLIDEVRRQSVGEKVVKSTTPGQTVVKIVHDQILSMLGTAAPLNLQAEPPIPFLMVGLQGSGKTTTTAKIANKLQHRYGKKVLMASLDTQRPAAQQQLAILGQQIKVDTLPIIAGQKPIDITRRALQTAKLSGYDVVMLDTAGRLHVDEELMREVVAIHDLAKPVETLLVVDAMTGQDSVRIAQSFQQALALTGIVLSRMDGDARGGAALSMRHVTSCPIKLLGVGEKIADVEEFYPDRIASRILGMGDIVSLVEKAAQTIQKDEAEALANKMQKGQFDLNDLAKQLEQVGKMGGINSIVKMLPGMGKLQEKLAEHQIDERKILHQRAIISAMTKLERRNPDIIKASRKQRIAKGSGTSVQEVNRLLKQFQDMQRMMKFLGKSGSKGLMRQGLTRLLNKGF